MSRGFRAYRVSISNLLLLMAVFAVALAWRRDNQRLINYYETRLNPRPPWGTVQATGAPDTQGFGDLQTAWASATQDGQKEWLIAEFEKAVLPSEIAIYETFNPGAVYQISGLNEFGKESVLWSGTDPTPTTASGGISKIPLVAKSKFKRIKIYVDSPSVPGWTEIDAIGLTDGNLNQWAIRVKASSTYSSQYGSLFPLITVR